MQFEQANQVINLLQDADQLLLDPAKPWVVLSIQAVLHIAQHRMDIAADAVESVSDTMCTHQKGTSSSTSGSSAPDAPAVAHGASSVCVVSAAPFPPGDCAVARAGKAAVARNAAP
jgi:hypothetical protein